MSDIYLGLMSGTSMDAVDAVAVQFDHQHLQLLASHSATLASDLRDKLSALCRGELHNMAEFAQLDIQLGKLFANTAHQLLTSAKLSRSQIKAIGSHGQTVWHISQGADRTSIQLGDPNIIAEQTGITTIADFRRRDIAAGGQGAPLVPAFHAAYFRAAHENRVVLNIGGIANITILPKNRHESVRGFDTGPGNTLLDMWANGNQRGRFDQDGAFAQQGTVLPEVLAKLMADPYFVLAPPKSTGREYFNRHWLEKTVGNVSRYPAADLQATLSELTAQTICDAIHAQAATTQRILICGGGIHNRNLIQRLQALLPAITIESTVIYGIDPQWVEAIAFAWLAKQTIENQPGNLPSVTGASRPCVLGAIYPGK